MGKSSYAVLRDEWRIQQRILGYLEAREREVEDVIKNLRD